MPLPWESGMHKKLPPFLVILISYSIICMLFVIMSITVLTYTSTFKAVWDYNKLVSMFISIPFSWCHCVQVQMAVLTFTL